MLVINVEFLNLKKQITISNKELAKGISARFDTKDKLELIAGILYDIKMYELEPPEKNALKAYLDNIIKQLND